jgi:hypothetical protein
MERSPAWEARLRRALVAAGVVACLLFSVGEGLRLTPPPVSALAEAAEAPHGFDRPRPERLNKQNPLDVPAQAQKRGKRAAVEFGCPPRARDAETPAPAPEPSFARAFSNRPQARRGAPSAGRAPPAHS